MDCTVDMGGFRRGQTTIQHSPASWDCQGWGIGQILATIGSHCIAQNRRPLLQEQLVESTSDDGGAHCAHADQDRDMSDQTHVENTEGQRPNQLG